MTMLTAISRPATDDDRGLGRLTPPAYTWVNQGFSCIAYEWIGDASYETGRRVTHDLYRLEYQVRGVGTAILGQIEFSETKGGWLIVYVGRHSLPSGESLVYATYEEATAYLYQQHQETKRKAVLTAVEA